MKHTNRLVALLLALVMVLGMLPATTAHAHEHHTHALETNGVEDYPALELGVEFTANIEGTDHYVTFTPELSTQYRFVGLGEGDTRATLYDDQNTMIASADDCYMHDHANTRQFCITAVLEAGKTYVLQHNYYNSGTVGTYNILVTHEHYYEGTVTVPNTCTEDGVMTYSCACGEAEPYTEVIPAAHSYDDEGVCTVCGEVYLLTGECGENLTWEMDWNGNLTIKGTGDMYNYLVSWGDDKYPAPWYDYRDDVTTITVEDGVTSIGNYAFYYCQYATELTLPESVTALGSNSFNSCYGLTEVVLPDGITEIPDSCFYYCGSLADVQWPASLTTIGSNAFNSCNLGDLIVPEGVTTLGQYVFGGNSNLTKLTLPATLTEVADYAFSRMWNVKDFVFKGDAPTFGGSHVFQWITANAWYPLGNETWTEEVKQNYDGTITWNGICSGSHTWGDPVTVPATCETGSYMTMSCSVCGYTEVSPENDDALGHDYQTEHYDGGCGDYSYDITTCSRCDYYSTENWTWTDHTYEESHVDATCEVGGYDVYTCIYCGYYYESNYTAPLGHDVAEWSEPSEATCTEDGVKTGHCARCDLDVSEVVTPALGHEWDMENGTANDDGSVTYSCIRCDATYTTEGTSLRLGDNQFTIEANAMSGTKTYTAAENGKLTIYLSDLYYVNTWINDWTTLAIDYAFSEGAFNVYVNDVNTGYTVEGSEIEAHIILDTMTVAAGDVVEVEISHTSASWVSNTDVRFNVNLALEVAHTHSYEIVVTAPTCTEGGYTTYTCTECGDSYVADETPAMGHSEAEAVKENEKAATCTEAGSYDSVVYCSVCGEELSRETVTVDALGHTEEVIPAVEPTCTETGLTEGKKCAVCDEILVAQEEIPALGHDWEGLNCTRCDATRENPFTDVDPVNHASFLDAILWAVDEKITTGATDTTFDPTGACLRGHVVTFLWRAAGEPEPTITENPFTDVKETDFFYKAVLWAVEEKITNGTSETEFSPFKECNRAQVVTFLYRAEGEPEVTNTVNPFSDVDVSQFYGNAVLWAVEKNITNGMGDGTFGVNTTCNRAQVVTFLYRTYKN